MTTKKCDNFSVGVLIFNAKDELLLIERKKFPYGFAAPAGHIDEFASPEECAKGEVFEEVGLTVTELELLHEKKYANPCRREGGSYHYWYVYKASVKGSLLPSQDETKSYLWCSRDRLQSLIKRTEEYEKGEITEEDWENSPGLEPVWVHLLRNST